MKKVKRLMRMCSFKQRIRPGSLMRALFPDPSMAGQATEIAHAMIKVCSLRMSDLASNMNGSILPPTNASGAFSRSSIPTPFYGNVSRKMLLMDITEIPRSQARRTE